MGGARLGTRGLGIKFCKQQEVFFFKKTPLKELTKTKKEGTGKELTKTKKGGRGRPKEGGRAEEK